MDYQIIFFSRPAAEYTLYVVSVSHYYGVVYHHGGAFVLTRQHASRDSSRFTGCPKIISEVYRIGVLSTTISGTVVEAQTLQMPGVRFGAPRRELIERRKETSEQRRRQGAAGATVGSEVVAASSLLGRPTAEVSQLRSEGSQHHVGRVRDLVQTSREDPCMGAQRCLLRHHQLIDVEDLPAGIRQETCQPGVGLCPLPRAGGLTSAV